MLLIACLQNLNCLRNRAISIFINEFYLKLMNSPPLSPPFPPNVLCSCAIWSLLFGTRHAEVVRKSSGKNEVVNCAGLGRSWFQRGLRLALDSVAATEGGEKTCTSLCLKLCFPLLILRVLRAAGLCCSS